MSEDPSAVRNFSTLFAALEDGRFNREVTDALRDLTAALNDAPGGAAKGSLTFTLNFKLDGGVMEVAGDYKVKAPKLARGRSVFWVTPDNNLTRRNPNQPDLPFREVTVPSARGLA